MGDVLLLSVPGLICWHIRKLHKEGRWMVLDPLNTFWAGILVCYVLQPIIAADIFISWHSESIFHKTLVAVIVGLGAVVAGYESRLGPEVSQRLPRFPPG